MEFLIRLCGPYNEEAERDLFEPPRKLQLPAQSQRAPGDREN